jgi:hypothetical protein
LRGRWSETGRVRGRIRTNEPTNFHCQTGIDGAGTGGGQRAKSGCAFPRTELRSPPRRQFSVLPPLFRHTEAVLFSFDQVSSSRRNTPDPTMRTPSFKPSDLLRTGVLAVLLAGLPISAGGYGLAATQARAQGHGDGGEGGGGRADSARGSGSSGEAKVDASPQWARSARQLLRRLLTSAARPPAPIPIAGVVAPGRRAAVQSAGHSRDAATVLISHPPPPASHLSPKLVPPQKTLPPIPD